jgi:Leucine-rich repeat (LRR) protein
VIFLVVIIIDDDNSLDCKSMLTWLCFVSTRLKYINASYNRLGKFPDALGSLFKVEEADFSYNNIQTVDNLFVYVYVCVG